MPSNPPKTASRALLTPVYLCGLGFAVGLLIPPIIDPLFSGPNSVGKFAANRLSAGGLPDLASWARVFFSWFSVWIVALISGIALAYVCRTQPLRKAVAFAIGFVVFTWLYFEIDVGFIFWRVHPGAGNVRFIWTILAGNIITFTLLVGTVALVKKWRRTPGRHGFPVIGGEESGRDGEP